MAPVRQLQPLSRSRLWAWLLSSALVHAALAWPTGAPAPVALRIPAPELAVAFTPGRQAAAAPASDPTPLSRMAAASSTHAAAPPEPAAAAPADAVTNHLRSLLQECIDRHFIYPPMARRHGWEGRVELLVRLDPQGRLHGLQVLHSSGYPLLDEDALLTLRRIGSIPQARAWLPDQGYATTLPVIYRLTEG